MGTKNVLNKVFRFMFALVLGAFISAFSMGACTALAAETVQEEAVVQDADTANEEGADDSGSGMILILGGMLLIIIVVVISVVSSVVSVAPIVDEL